MSRSFTDTQTSPVVGLTPMPTGLRMPDAYTPTHLPSGVNSRTAARFFSAGTLSGSSILEPEPTDTNMLRPSRENATSRVSWKSPGPDLMGISLVTTSAAPEAFRSPALYANFTMEPAFPTYTHCGL